MMAKGRSEMEWVLPVVICLLELLGAVGQIISCAQDATTSRTEHRLSKADDWKCPDAAEFGRILRRQDHRANERAARDALPSLSLNNRHALWDRELDG
jgi:hypothetical protein